MLGIRLPVCPSIPSIVFPPQPAQDRGGTMKQLWSSLTTSLAGLRRLSQPYFLPLEAGAGSFVLLLAALVAVVVDLSLLLLMAALAFSAACSMKPPAPLMGRPSSCCMPSCCAGA